MNFFLLVINDSLLFVLETILFLLPWLKIVSILSKFRSYLLKESKLLPSSPDYNSKASKVSLQDCIPYLDNLSLNLSWIECRELFDLIMKINHSLYLMKELSSEFRSNGVNFSAQQSQRIQKLSESINSMQFILYPIPVFGSSPTISDPTALATKKGSNEANEKIEELEPTDESILNHMYYYHSASDLLFFVPPPSPSTVAATSSSTSTASASTPGTSTNTTTKPLQPIQDAKCLYTYLPDADYLQYFMMKTKTQLKVIEEMAGSKKNDNLKFKFSGKKTLYTLINQYSSSVPSINKVFDLSILKYQMRDLLALLDHLEILLLKHHLVLSYFQFIKQSIHQPYHQILLQMKSLPNLIEWERRMSIDYDNFVLQEKAYLQKITDSSNHQIPSDSRENNPSNTQLLTMRQQYSSNEDHHNSLIFRFLSILYEHQLFGNEIAKMIVEYYTTHQLSSNKVFLHEVNHVNNTKVLSSLQKEIIRMLFTIKLTTTGSSFSLSDYPEMKQCLTERENRDIVTAISLFIHQLVNEQQRHTTTRGNSNLLNYEDFPVERFSLCLQEYKKRQSLLDTLSMSKDFHQEYEDLLMVRLKFQRAHRRYEGGLDQYHQQLLLYLEILQELDEFQRRYCQFVLDEFHQMVIFESKSA